MDRKSADAIDMRRQHSLSRFGCVDKRRTRKGATSSKYKRMTEYTDLLWYFATARILGIPMRMLEKAETELGRPAYRRDL